MALLLLPRPFHLALRKKELVGGTVKGRERFGKETGEGLLLQAQAYFLACWVGNHVKSPFFLSWAEGTWVGGACCGLPKGIPV